MDPYRCPHLEMKQRIKRILETRALQMQKAHDHDQQMRNERLAEIRLFHEESGIAPKSTKLRKDVQLDPKEIQRREFTAKVKASNQRAREARRQRERQMKTVNKMPRQGENQANIEVPLENLFDQLAIRTNAVKQPDNA